MEQIAGGWKRNYYGKGDVIVYRLNRGGHTPEDRSPVFGANVKILIYGDAFWHTYTTGDNTGLIATTDMCDFAQPCPGAASGPANGCGVCPKKPALRI